MPRNNPSGYRADPILRPDQQPDLGQRRLIQKLVREVEHREPPEIAGRWWWIMRDQPVERPVGYCALTPGLSGAAVLTTAGIRELHRGHGLHRRMITLREQCARRAGLDHCLAEVDCGNVRAVNNLIDSCYRLKRGGPRLLFYRRL